MKRSIDMRARQQGVALAIGLLLLLVLTVIGIGAMRSSVVELQMSRNEESRISAFQHAQSLIDGTLADPDNMLVSGQPGDIACLPRNAGTNDCNAGAGTVDIDSSLLEGADDERSSVYVRRLSPDYVPAPRGLGFSVDFDAAQFEVSATYDATASKLGRSSMAQGVMVLVKVSQ